MKTLSITLVSLIACLSAYAQNSDFIQPDSIYRMYNIRYQTSTEGTYTKAKEIFVFDKNGRNIAFKLTDNETGLKPQLIFSYQYNKDGVLIAENDTSLLTGSKEVKYAKLMYAANGKLAKKTIMLKSNIVSETEYFDAEHKETKRLYRKGKLYREQTTYYDAHNKKIRFTGSEPNDKDAKPRTFVVNGKTFVYQPSAADENWDYRFENTYDKEGRLIKQQRYVDKARQEELVFTYDTRGLLVQVKQSNHADPVIIEYTYY